MNYFECIYCHQLIKNNHIIDCDNCLVSYTLVENNIQYVAFKNNYINPDHRPRKFHIAMNIEEGFTIIYRNTILKPKENHLLKIPCLFWIFPQNIPYWENKFRKLVPIL